LGTIFVLFGGSLLAEGLFHSEEPEVPGYEIVVAESAEGDGDAGAAQEEAPSIAALLQNASADAGANVFKKCVACHTGEKGGANKIGPHLWDVVMRPIAGVSDFSYSSAMQDFSEGGAVQWDYEHLNGFLENPQGYMSGTAMGFPGVKDDEDRADLIAYLRSLADEPAPLPEAPAEGAADAGDEQTAEVTEPGTTTKMGAGGEEAQATPDAGPANAAPTESGDETTTAEMSAQNNQLDTSADEAAGSEAAQSDAAPSGSSEEQASDAAAAEGSGDQPEDAAAASGDEAQPAEEATQTAMAGDPAAGEKVFNKCRACHAVGEGAANKIGPELNGIVGEAVAEVEGYSFSSALQEYAQENPTWTVENLHAWLSDPRGLVSGTKMVFPGLKNQEDIDNVIAYLATFDESGAQSQ